MCTTTTSKFSSYWTSYLSMSSLTQADVVPIVKLSSICRCPNRAGGILSSIVITLLLVQFLFVCSSNFQSQVNALSSNNAHNNFRSSNYRPVLPTLTGKHHLHHHHQPQHANNKSQSDHSRSQFSKHRKQSSTEAIANDKRLKDDQLVAAESAHRNVYDTEDDVASDILRLNKSSSINFQCPEQFGYFADSTDCSRYFVCVFGDPLHETCTGGLYFSSELQTCDWPQNVECLNSPSNRKVAPSTKNAGQSHSNRKNIGEGNGGYVSDSRDDGESTESSVDKYGTNDLDQTQFDESIASFIDQNGDVYVHDGPGGLYSLIERTAAISDHDRPLIYRSASSTTSIPSPVNSIEKKNPIDKPQKSPIYKKVKPSKCTKNCTFNQNVQFDDEIDEYNQNNNNGQSQFGRGQQQQHQPEHLRPRPNIVKKQLKDFEMEFFNKVDDLEDDDETDNRKNRNTFTAATPKQQSQTEIPIITFVASKSDLWNLDRVKQSGNSEQASKYSSINSQQNNKPQAYTSAAELDEQMAKLSYKFRRSEKDGGTSSLTDDSLMQVFRGREQSAASNTNRRNYLLQSFNTFPLPFPANLVKPWKNSALSSSNNNRQGKSNKMNLPLSPTVPVVNTSLPASKATTPPSTEIHIFYSYRNNPHQSSNKKASNQSLPIATVSRVKETKDPNQSEIFTIRSSDYLLNNNKNGSLGNGNNNNIVANNIAATPLPSVSLLYDYRYSGKSSASSTNRNNNLASSNVAKVATVSSTPASVPYQQPHLYSNYTNYESFESVKSQPIYNATTSTTTTSTTTPAPPTTTTPSNVQSMHSNRLVDFATVSIKNSDLFSFHSSGSGESSRPKNIPSICDPSLNCKLPKCFCPGTKTPYGFKRTEIPQMILLTFDDAVNDVNFPLYEEIFEHISSSQQQKQQQQQQAKRKRTNPNGCPIRGTFFVSHEWTDYGKVQTLYARKHEIASHSITHTFGEKYSTAEWRREMVGQREILHRYAGIPREDIRGMRAPFLQIGGDQQFQMLMDGNFSYDSSIAIFDNSPPFWPYTMDFSVQHDCMITPCPTRSYPGLWEIGLIMWQDLIGGGRCTMGNSCTSPPDEQGVFELIMSNFKRHYTTNRAPFGLYYQSGWFANAHHKAGFLRFIDEVLRLGDVFFVTNWQALQWMKQPTRLADIEYFQPWQCEQEETPSRREDSLQSNKVHECLLPNICHVKFRKKNSVGSRYFKTCQTCPIDYPWIDNVDQLLDQQ